MWKGDVRFFGAGVIGISAIWTLVKIAGPVIGGVRSALAASAARGKGETLALEERDLPIAWVALRASRPEAACRGVAPTVVRPVSTTANELV